MENTKQTIFDAGTRSPTAGSHDNVDILQAIEPNTYFEIVLKSNPHNGYMWYVKNENSSSGLSSGVSFVGQDMQPLPRYSGTRQHFTFYANSPSSHVIAFVYRRSWEVDPYATFTANVYIGT